MQDEKNSIDPKKDAFKERLTWKDDMIVKDLVKPITLRRVRLIQIMAFIAAVAITGVFLWLKYLQPPSGEKLVAEMIQAAGGMDAWKQIHQGSFLRTHKMYDEKGNIIKQDDETFYFMNNDQGHQLMIKSHSMNGDDVVIGQDANNHYWGSLNGESGDAHAIAKKMEYMCHDDECVPLCSSEMAFYRFSMPFNLIDPGVIPKYTGTATLNGKKAMLLDVTFDPKIGKDRWVFYVDPSSKLIRKIEHYSSLESNEQPEEIYWSDFKPENNVTIAHSNKYYRSNGRILEEYQISNVNFNPAFTNKFFNSPMASQ